MNDACPQMLNDDFIRTWTVIKSNTNSVQVMIKKKGIVSRYLHDDHLVLPMQVKYKGCGGGCKRLFLFQVGSFEKNEIPRFMVWCAAGIGITPFLGMF